VPTTASAADQRCFQGFMLIGDQKWQQAAGRDWQLIEMPAYSSR